MQDEKYLAKLRTHWKQNAVFPAMTKLCEVVELYSTSSVFALESPLSDAAYLEQWDASIGQRAHFQDAALGRQTRSVLRTRSTPPASVLSPQPLLRFWQSWSAWPIAFAPS